MDNSPSVLGSIVPILEIWIPLCLYKAFEDNNVPRALSRVDVYVPEDLSSKVVCNPEDLPTMALQNREIMGILNNFQQWIDLWIVFSDMLPPHIDDFVR